MMTCCLSCGPEPVRPACHRSLLSNLDIRTCALMRSARMYLQCYPPDVRGHVKGSKFSCCEVYKQEGRTTERYLYHIWHSHYHATITSFYLLSLSERGLFCLSWLLETLSLETPQGHSMFCGDCVGELVPGLFTLRVQRIISVHQRPYCFSVVILPKWTKHILWCVWISNRSTSWGALRSNVGTMWRMEFFTP